MKIDVGNCSIETNSYAHNLNSKCWVRRIISGYGLSFQFAPYKAYLVEWKGYGEIFREILLLPAENTEHWLDDWVRERESDDVIIMGCAELKAADLPEYEPPAYYRAEIEKERAMWEEIGKADEE